MMGSGVGMIVLLIYLGVIVYFFYLMNQIATSVKRIADRLEKNVEIMPVNRESGE